jgi:hypothetical protein
MIHLQFRKQIACDLVLAVEDRAVNGKEYNEEDQAQHHSSCPIWR